MLCEPRHWNERNGWAESDGQFVKAAELIAFVSKFACQPREILKESGAKVVR